MATLTTRGAFILLIPAALLLSGCGEAPGAHPQKLPAAIVIVSEPIEMPVVDKKDYTGRTDAAESVEIRARVTGFLKKVMFEEGAEVENDAALYEIDDREYQADLASARAEHAGALAHQEKATTDFKRMEALKAKGAASAEEYDRADAAKKEADASVQAAEAKQERAQLNVDFTKIAAPISGKISRSQITEGNLVNADKTVLTTIVSVEPIQVYFDVDERTMLTLRERVRKGSLASKRDQEIPVLMGLVTDKDYPHAGTIDFVENRVDPRTGTFRVRGTFKNPRPEKGERVLEAGLFARVRVPIGEPQPALLVAERAIGTDQGQKFLYVVNEKNEVVYRPVQLGAQHDGLRAIDEGLKAGERVIIDGLQRVRPGSVVEPKPGDMHSRPGGAARDKRPASGESAGESGAEKKQTETPSQ